MYTNEFPTPNLHESLQLLHDHQYDGWLPNYPAGVHINHGQDTTELTLLVYPHIVIQLTATGTSTRLAYKVTDQKDPLDIHAVGSFDLDHCDSYTAARHISRIFLRGTVSPQRKEGDAVTEIHAADMAAHIKNGWGDDTTELCELTKNHAVVDFHSDGLEDVRLTITTGNHGRVPWYAYQLIPSEGTPGMESARLYRAGTISTQGEYDGVIGTDTQDGEIDNLLDEISRRSDHRTVEEKLSNVSLHSMNLVSMKQGH